MQVVNGVTPVVLNVPTETGEAHAHIAPGHLHARNVSVDVAQHGLFQAGKVVQVPS